MLLWSFEDKKRNLVSAAASSHASAPQMHLSKMFMQILFAGGLDLPLGALGSGGLGGSPSAEPGYLSSVDSGHPPCRRQSPGADEHQPHALVTSGSLLSNRKGTVLGSPSPVVGS